jgi:hypothetical protein
MDFTLRTRQDGASFIKCSKGCFWEADCGACEHFGPGAVVRSVGPPAGRKSAGSAASPRSAPLSPLVIAFLKRFRDCLGIEQAKRLEAERIRRQRIGTR